MGRRVENSYRSLTPPQESVPPDLPYPTLLSYRRGEHVLPVALPLWGAGNLG